MDSVECDKPLCAERKNEFITIMREWYLVLKTKSYVGRILEFYNQRKQSIGCFNTVVNISKRHWIFIKVNIPKPSTDDSSSEISVPVISIDNYDSSDYVEDVKRLRMCFSKFFGLYYKKICLGKKLTNHDFDGHDIIYDMKQGHEPTKIATRETDSSMLSHAVQEPQFKQPDDYNCGVIALYHCISASRSDTEYEKRMNMYCNKNGSLLKDDLENKRVQICGILGETWSWLYGEMIEKYREHLILNLDHKTNSVPNNDDIQRWTVCLQLFEDGHREYKYGDPESTANKIFQSNQSTSNMFAICVKDTTTESDDSSLNVFEDPSKNNDNSKKRKRKKSKSKKQNDKPPDDLSSYLNTWCIRTIMSRKNTVRDVSNSRVLLNADEVDNIDMATNISMSPYELGEHIQKFFMDSYFSPGVFDETVDEMNEFSTYVKEVMSRYITLFIMDVIPDENDGCKIYEVVAAIILEPEVKLGIDYINHALIHMFGIRSGYERESHPKILLYYLATHCVLLDAPVIFMHQCKGRRHLVRNTANRKGDIAVTPETIFREMSFSYKKNESLDYLIEPENPNACTSKYMFGRGEMMKITCEKHLKKQIQYRICKLPGTNFVGCKKDKAGVYWFYTHAFKWMQATTEQLGYITKAASTFCEANVDESFCLTGGGYRPRNDAENLTSEDKKELLRDEFQVLNNERFSNCCAWLSAALLINVENEDIATHMLKLMDNDFTDYEWMCLTKDPHQKFKVTGGNLLIQRLQKKPIKYDLRRVAYLGKNKTYLDIMLDKETKGQYICQLKTSVGTSRHVVGIDCNKKVIFDCCERYALKLSLKNLHYCCGENFAKLDKIVYCYQLVKK